MTRLLTWIFFSAFMMTSFQGQTSGFDEDLQWEGYQRRQDRRLTHALAQMDLRNNAADRAVAKEELALERRRVALEERRYLDEQKEKERARQKARAKAEAAQRHQQKKEEETQALAYLLDWKKKLDTKPTYAYADDFVKKAVAEYKAAQMARTHLSQDLVAQLLDRKAKTDAALHVVAEDLRKGTHRDDPEYEAQLRKRYTGGHGYATFTWDYVTSLLEREKEIANIRKYGVAVW